MTHLSKYPTSSGMVHSDDDDNPVIAKDSDPVMGGKPRVSRYCNNFRVRHLPQYCDNYVLCETPQFYAMGRTQKSHWLVV